MRITYYDEFSRLNRLKPPFAWALGIAVAGLIVLFLVEAL